MCYCAATLKHVAQTVAHVQLSDHLVDVVFVLFDENGQYQFFCLLIDDGAQCGAGAPLIPLSIYFLIFSPFYFFLFFLGFTYFLLLSIPSLSTRIVPLRFLAGGRRRRPNPGLVCFFV